METRLCVSTRITSGEEVFNRYFPDVNFSYDDHRVMLFRALLQKFFSTDSGRKALSQSQPYRNHYTLWIDYRQLEPFKIRNLKDALLASPMDALNCLSAGGHQAMTTYRMEVPKEKLLVRLFNFRPSELSIQSMKASWIGKLATITGTVMRVTPSKPLFQSLTYSCAKCGWNETRNFADGVTQVPAKCTRPNCRNRRLQPELQSAVMIDWQKLRIQETVPIEKQIHGAVPRTMDVELRDDLVNSCRSGESVTVTGIVKVFNSKSERDLSCGNEARMCDLFLLYLDATSIRKANHELENEDPLQDVTLLRGFNEFSKQDLDFISELYHHCNGDQLKQLVHAFCPGICGHELIKAGTLLALVGGVSKQVDANERVPVRGDVHLLLVGDPGMGKSELLKAAASIAPRGVYVCGNTSSSTGLTASVVKDNITGDFTFEAGAMVLANGGVCCIDEFDRLQTQHQSLLEAMEQQEVSIAKAGLVASLPSKTTVIAAANPADGHYQRSKTLKQNLRIDAPMLSRFDLIYLLIDKPDSQLDLLLSEHILSTTANIRKGPKQQRVELRGRSKSVGRTLEESLQLGPQESSCSIPNRLIQKYLSYARHYIKPKLSNEAAELIKDFYLKLRNANCVADEIPITARQLESLIRISEARAKIDLREIVTKRDAEDAVNLVKTALYDKFIDDQNILHEVVSKGHNKTSNDLEQLLMVLQHHRASQERDTINLEEIYAIADDLDIHRDRVKDLVGKLNDQGDLLKRGGQCYKISRPQGSFRPETPRTVRVTGTRFATLSTDRRSS